MAIFDKTFDPEERDVVREILLGVASALAAVLIYKMFSKR